MNDFIPEDHRLSDELISKYRNIALEHFPGRPIPKSCVAFLCEECMYIIDCPRTIIYEYICDVPNIGIIFSKHRYTSFRELMTHLTDKHTKHCTIHIDIWLNLPRIVHITKCKNSWVLGEMRKLSAIMKYDFYVKKNAIIAKTNDRKIYFSKYMHLTTFYDNTRIGYNNPGDSTRYTCGGEAYFGYYNKVSMEDFDELTDTKGIRPISSVLVTPDVCMYVWRACNKLTCYINREAPGDIIVVCAK